MATIQEKLGVLEDKEHLINEGITVTICLFHNKKPQAS